MNVERGREREIVRELLRVSVIQCVERNEKKQLRSGRNCINECKRNVSKLTVGEYGSDHNE